uniref:acylphosphatase n=1 Tax=Pelusios castaneus TaxID=367368 RepID=A0A8C8VFH5_9SAUR
MSGLVKACGALKSVDYEVFGRVQGRCRAKKVGNIKWMKNIETDKNCVMQVSKIQTGGKAWLSKVGSPGSRIDRTNFSNEKEISKLDFSGFSTRY